VSKRLTKTPKLYFHDVGLASWLLGIESAAQLTTHPLRGALFENLAVSDVLKYRYNSGRRGNLHFYRDSSGLEVDLIYPLANRHLPIEVKAGQTVTGSQTVALEKFASLFPGETAEAILVHGGDDFLSRGKVTSLPVRALVPRLREMEARLP
jgi:predicted AAA+ superfamily ATPase